MRHHKNELKKFKVTGNTNLGVTDADSENGVTQPWKIFFSYIWKNGNQPWKDEYTAFSTSKALLGSWV